MSLKVKIKGEKADDWQTGTTEVEGEEKFSFFKFYTLLLMMHVKEAHTLKSNLHLRTVIYPRITCHPGQGIGIVTPIFDTKNAKSSCALAEAIFSMISASRPKCSS